MTNQLLTRWANQISRNDNVLPLNEPADQIVDMFRYLDTTGVEWNLLHAAARCWNSTLHVFQFGLHEVCPIYEEWCALLELTQTGPLIQPTYLGTRASIFNRLLKNPVVNAYPLFKDGKIYITKIIQAFAPNSQIANPRFESCRRNALILCFFARFLVFQDSNTASSVLADLVDQVNQGRNPVPTMLAETFDGLDRSVGKEKGIFTGCIKLLYVWLSEKLQILKPPASNFTILRKFSSWIRLVEPKSVDEWYNWLQSIDSNQINWKYTLFRNVTLHTHKDSYIHFLGLEKTSFYIPDRVMRQLGGLQIQSVVTPPSCEALNSVVVNHVVAAWKRRSIVKRPMIETKELETTSDYYPVIADELNEREAKKARIEEGGSSTV